MFATPAFAQATGNGALAGGAAGAAAGLFAFLPYIAIFAIFYVLMIRPQQQRAKAHRDLIDGVKKGDEVVTGGGIIGKVVRVADSEVDVEVATGVKLRVVKSTLADVRDRTLPAAANDSSKAGG